MYCLDLDSKYRYALKQLKTLLIISLLGLMNAAAFAAQSTPNTQVDFSIHDADMVAADIRVEGAPPFYNTLESLASEWGQAGFDRPVELSEKDIGTLRSSLSLSNNNMLNGEAGDELFWIWVCAMVFLPLVFQVLV